MSLDTRIFAYCERGTDPGFLAEPLNAVTNGAFVLAGLAILVPALRRSSDEGRAMPIVFAVLIVAIGIGSFLFHTFATPWAAIADLAPIGLFMIVYFAYALRTWLRSRAFWVAALTLGFVLALWGAGQITCGVDGSVTFGGSGGRCLNGSVGYLPALIALAGIGGLLAARGHRAGRALLAAACVFAVSLTFRILDWELCPDTVIAGYQFGTHFLWHILNAVTLYIIARPTLRTWNRTEPAPA